MINVGLVARSVTVTSLILVCFKMSFGLQDICFVICHSFSGFFWEVQCNFIAKFDDFIWWIIQDERQCKNYLRGGEKYPEINKKEKNLKER